MGGGEDCCNRSACCRVGRERMQEWRCAQTGREVGGRENFRSESTEAPLAPDGDAAVAGGAGNLLPPSFKAYPGVHHWWESRQTHKLQELWS